MKCFVGLLCLFSAGTSLAAPAVPQSGCIDCFNFVAPQILGAETINPAEVGLIVFDATHGFFRGYNSSGFWSKLSHEQPIKTISTATATLNPQDEFVKVDATAAAVTVSLPAALLMKGRELLIKKIDSSTNTVIIDPNGSETIDGDLTRSIGFTNDLMRLTSDGTGWHSTLRLNQAPTIQKFASGSGTYTTPAGVAYLRVRMVGGGGGGSGAGTASTMGAGGNGGNTTFGGTLLVANFGGGGAINRTGGSGGTASIGTGAYGITISGSGGANGAYTGTVNTQNLPGGIGASSTLAGGGRGGSANAGTAATSNTGAGGGGGGAGAVASIYSGGGGGAAGYLEAVIPNPASSYAYVVGSAGAAGTAGTSGAAGGAGGSGYIIIEEYYK